MYGCTRYAHLCVHGHATVSVLVYRYQLRSLRVCKCANVRVVVPVRLCERARERGKARTCACATSHHGIVQGIQRANTPKTQPSLQCPHRSKQVLQQNRLEVERKRLEENVSCSTMAIQVQHFKTSWWCYADIIVVKPPLRSIPQGVVVAVSHTCAAQTR